ncbi:MAG TPA: glycosyltransferase family 2 protein [Candidatus Omnitrophota bacterium]|nr:glycosyltransferase family 2 protein [Candidatus Omnitrophota bacterium]
MISIIILNWNGREFLERCIPSVKNAVNSYGGPCEIIVVDNASSDDSIEYIKNNFPGIRIEALDRNYGFAKGMNEGVRRSRGEIIIGLNNDTEVEEGFVRYILRDFDAGKQVFAVAAKMLLFDRKTLNFGRAVGTFRFGVFRRYFEEPEKPCNCLYACGGAFAARKNIFLELGGFDEDMINFWEDTDLCYRAWKKGYKTIYEPKALVYHKMHGSFEKVCGEKGVRLLSGENYFLFAIKNFHDNGLFLRHLFVLPFLFISGFVIFKPYFSIGMLKSARRWKFFLKKRELEKAEGIFGDRQVLAMSNR